MRAWILMALASTLPLWCEASAAADSPAPNRTNSGMRTFAVKGVVQELSRNEQTVVIRHDAVSNYMSAMTMPFKVKQATELAGLKPGAEITFQLHVTDTDSWIGAITRAGTVSLTGKQNLAGTQAPASLTSTNRLLDYNFTNELGQAVSLNAFRGQALAVTFFYTRCPLPNACPRLSRNFEQAEHKLEAMTNAPANWHFISVSFDPQFDTPALLKAYGQGYQYEPKHWSFLTGPADKIGELARACSVSYQADGATLRHNFRTLIVNAAGHVQTVFPTGGDLSEQIVAQILTAAATNSAVAMAQSR